MELKLKLKLNEMKMDWWSGVEWSRVDGTGAGGVELELNGMGLDWWSWSWMGLELELKLN